MEEHKKIISLLDQISLPGFLVRDGVILQVNQAAGAMLVAPGQRFSTLLSTGAEEYSDFSDGQLCVTLTVCERARNAVIIRMEEGDLVLLDSDLAQDEFRSMSLIAMELRKPLMQAISGSRQQPADAKTNRSLMQMLRMVSNMADIGRYAVSSRMETRDADAFLAELFEKAQTLTEGQAQISYEGLGQPVFTMIDPEQLERAVWNILSNSLKFLPPEGFIRAKLRRSRNSLRLTVSDNAVAVISGSEFFARYLRQPGIEDSRCGLGIGLSIVRTVAANHGGTLLISSSEKGTDVSFTISLRQTDGCSLRSPLLRPDYTGGWDHALVELSDSLSPERYLSI